MQYYPSLYILSVHVLVCFHLYEGPLECHFAERALPTLIECSIYLSNLTQEHHTIRNVFQEGHEEGHHQTDDMAGLTDSHPKPRLQDNPSTSMTRRGQREGHHQAGYTAWLTDSHPKPRSQDNPTSMTRRGQREGHRQAGYTAGLTDSHPKPRSQDNPTSMTRRGQKEEHHQAGDTAGLTDSHPKPRSQERRNSREHFPHSPPFNVPVPGAAAVSHCVSVINEMCSGNVSDSMQTL